MKLIATYPILYQSRQYAIGEELLANDESMVSAWIEAGTASWQEEDPSIDKAKAVPAQTVTAKKVEESDTQDEKVGKKQTTPTRRNK